MLGKNVIQTKRVNEISIFVRNEIKLVVWKEELNYDRYNFM